MGAGRGRGGVVVPGREGWPCPCRGPHAAGPRPGSGPEPRSYSRALGALRAHDEAKLVDAALSEAVGL